MAFRGLTKKGADYLATKLANELAVEFLKVEIGDGAVLSGQNPKNQTSLISYKKQAKILKKEQENNAINITIQITNDDITQGFYLKEIGIYVNDSSDEGCLYWYCNEDNAQYIPAKSDSVIAFEIDIRMEVANSDATIINWSGKNTWINKEYLEENYTKNGGYNGTAREIEDRVVAAVGKEDGKFPLSEAVKGNVYYFTGNKKFYICKETQNRRVSVPDGNFEELSIWENRKRLENLNSFDILYSKTDDFGNWKDLTINLIKPVDDSKYSHYIIYTGQGNQITNSILVTSTTRLDLYFDCYQYSNPGRVGVAFATFVNSTTIKLKILEGQASGDGIVKILAFKKV